MERFPTWRRRGTARDSTPPTSFTAATAPARQVALGAGLPPIASALTVNMVCGWGLRAVMLASSAIRAGDAGLVLAGGMESMSNAPHRLRGGRSGWKIGDGVLVDSMLHD